MWYANYVNNYIERDVRALLNVRDLGVFQRFLRLCAARTGQLLNLAEIGNETGVTHNTVKAWISVLEASYILFLLQPYHTNFSKRLVKTPKLYFYDPGLLCWLLSIGTKEMLNLSPIRGSIFESYVLSELIKQRYNALETRNFFFWRDRSGNEIDLIVDHGLESTPVEIKSAMTFQPKFLKQAQGWHSTSGSTRTPALIYGGDAAFEHQGCRVIPWHAAQAPD
jgi:predicted AAA+ superfamily ATPase